MTRPEIEGKAGETNGTPVSDAPSENWVDRYAPAWGLPYLRLARADRPVGFYLLALPCFWSVALAGLHTGAAYPDPWLLLLFAIGAIAMRGAGCTYNDIVDREIDAKVTRTRTRPLPSGQISLRGAMAFLAGQCLVGLGALLSLNEFSIWLGVAVIPIVALYPFMKRISHWPQAVLGLAFNWGALMGWAAVTGGLDWAPVALYVGAVAWTVGYDTIYAHQDREDDALVGIKSTALRFGDDTKYWLSGFYAVTIVAMGLSGWLAGGGALFFTGLAFACGQLLWQIATLDIDNAENCLARFRSNRDFGLIVFFAILADMTLASSL